MSGKSVRKHSTDKKRAHPYGNRPKPRKQQGDEDLCLREIPKINADTVMELTSKFLCEDHSFPELRGLQATEMIFLTQALLYINLEEMNKHCRKKKREEARNIAERK